MTLFAKQIVGIKEGILNLNKSLKGFKIDISWK